MRMTVGGTANGASSGSGEASLVIALAGGDARAFEALFRMHVQSVFRYATYLTGDRERAHEITQDAWHLLWTKRRGIRDLGAGVLPWLFAVAKRLALKSNVRTAKRQASEAPMESVTAEAEWVSDRDTDLWIGLGRAFAEIDADDRLILYLSLVEGLSYSDVAAALGLTHAAVRNRLHRSRASVQRRLIEEGWRRS